MSDDSLFLKGSRQATRSNDAEARDAEAKDAEARDAEAKDAASAHDDRDRPARPTETEPVEHPDLGFDLGNLDPAARPTPPTRSRRASPPVEATIESPVCSATSPTCGPATHRVCPADRVMRNSTRAAPSRPPGPWVGTSSASRRIGSTPRRTIVATP
jgi:hypothetical protein